MACEDPREESGRPLKHWTTAELADEAIERGIAESIAPRSVGRFLGRGGSEPHRIRYWLNNDRAEEPEAFDAEVRGRFASTTAKHSPCTKRVFI